MNMKKSIIPIFLIVLTFAACRKQFQSVPLDAGYKKGIPLDKLIELKGKESLVATVETSLGAFQIELYPREAPKAVTNFIGLALQGYYNGLIFHRVIKDFMIQTGDSTGTGMGGRSIYGKEFEDEFSYSLRHDSPGVVSMVNKGPATNLSQFFVTTAATPWLDGKHTIFGKVIDGMETIYGIGRVKTDESGKPLDKVVLQKVAVEKRIY